MGILAKLNIRVNIAVDGVGYLMLKVYLYYVDCRSAVVIGS